MDWWGCMLQYAGLEPLSSDGSRLRLEHDPLPALSQLGEEFVEPDLLPGLPQLVLKRGHSLAQGGIVGMCLGELSGEGRWLRLGARVRRRRQRRGRHVLRRRLGPWRRCSRGRRSLAVSLDHGPRLRPPDHLAVLGEAHRAHRNFQSPFFP